MSDELKRCCLIPARQCWIFYVDALVLLRVICGADDQIQQDGGNIMDALCVGCHAALRDLTYVVTCYVLLQYTQG